MSVLIRGDEERMRGYAMKEAVWYQQWCHRVLSLAAMFVCLFVCLFVVGGVKFPESWRSFPTVMFKNTNLSTYRYLTMVLRLSLRRGKSGLLTILVLGLVGYASTPIAEQIYF